MQNRIGGSTILTRIQNKERGSTIKTKLTSLITRIRQVFVDRKAGVRCPFEDFSKENTNQIQLHRYRINLLVAAFDRFMMFPVLHLRVYLVRELGDRRTF